MNGAATSELGALGEILDRAVHRTVRRFGAAAPALILADASGSLLSFIPVAEFWWFAAALLLENRGRVVALASLRRAPGHRVAWSAALRHPAALLFAIPAALDYTVPYLTLFVVSSPFMLVTRTARILTAGNGFAALFYGVAVLVLLLATALLVVVLLLMLGAMAATIDTVLDGAPPLRALGFWLAQTFRRRGFGATLLAGAVFALLVIGTPFLLELIPLPFAIPHALYVALEGIPEGIADAIAVVFAWEWRDEVLRRRRGRDLELLLAAQSASSASPIASSPGVTTSQ